MRKLGVYCNHGVRCNHVTSNNTDYTVPLQPRAEPNQGFTSRKYLSLSIDWGQNFDLSVLRTPAQWGDQLRMSPLENYRLHHFLQMNPGKRSQGIKCDFRTDESIVWPKLKIMGHSNIHVPVFCVWTQLMSPWGRIQITVVPYVTYE